MLGIPVNLPCTRHRVLTSKRDDNRDEVAIIKMGILSNGTDKVDHRWVVTTIMHERAA